ncbi:hypothetical protein BDK51DRAFT_34886 [Blyttiomyces helicus]|uniref:Uncharacterized protein n=1 Tax=Blyttiomyces helicus TaxID=388810 RepID=A0A4V1ISU0_9FUNG|nr:hypothetical protein BDK51DRAFT_34886 [Blyttiomyces helicus]|eukprot:RKO94727.1 hypothetical protein BDK51DRAFT_34886 [Blyttiomyces helicus]
MSRPTHPPSPLSDHHLHHANPHHPAVDSHPAGAGVTSWPLPRSARPPTSPRAHLLDPSPRSGTTPARPTGTRFVQTTDSATLLGIVELRFHPLPYPNATGEWGELVIEKRIAPEWGSQGSGTECAKAILVHASAGMPAGRMAPASRVSADVPESCARWTARS